MSILTLKDLTPLQTPLNQQFNPLEGHLPYPFLLSTCTKDRASLMVSLALSTSGSDATAHYWGKELSIVELERLFTIPGAAITPAAMVERLRQSVLKAEMDVEGYVDDQKEVGPVTIKFHITDSITLSLQVEPKKEPFISLLALLRSTAKLATAADDLTALKVTHEATKRDLKRARDDVLRVQAKKARIGGASQPASTAGTSGQAAAEQKIVPGITHKAVLRPGDVGYAGNSRRAGIVQPATDEWDEDPSSDDD